MATASDPHRYRVAQQRQQSSLMKRYPEFCLPRESYDLDIITVEPPAEIEVYKTPRGNTFEVEVFNRIAPMTLR